MLRSGDLGYLHVHPEEGEPGPGVEFATAFPTPGTYRLFLDFQHHGSVHTAALTVPAGTADRSAALEAVTAHHVHQ